MKFPYGICDFEKIISQVGWAKSFSCNDFFIKKVGWLPPYMALIISEI
jgi:hypothetical protein